MISMKMFLFVKFKGKYEAEMSSYQHDENLKEMYDSLVTNLENNLKHAHSQIKELQEKYEKEFKAHQLAENLKKMYKSQIRILQGEKAKAEMQNTTQNLPFYSFPQLSQTSNDPGGTTKITYVKLLSFVFRKIQTGILVDN